MKKSITKQLEEKYGGKWKYSRSSHIWYCDELEMIAHYVYQGGYDIDGDMIENNITKKLSSLDTIQVYGNGKNGEDFFINKE